MARTHRTGVVLVVTAAVLVNAAPPGASAAGAPQVVCAKPDGDWHNDNVTIRCTASDPDGLALPGDAKFALRTSVPDATATANAATGTRKICDTRGTCTTAGPVTGNRVDRVPPTVTLRQPAEGGRYGLITRHGVFYNCADADAGIRSCQASRPAETQLPTGPRNLGGHNFTVIAEDRAGNRTKVTHRYTVEVIVPGNANRPPRGRAQAGPVQAGPVRAGPVQAGNTTS